MRNKPKYHSSVLMVLFALLSGAVSGQYVKIRGVITDSLTGEPLPFVNVVFKGKNIGTTSDLDGKYVLETQWGSPVLVFSSLGYYVKEVSLSEQPNQEVNVELAPKAHELKAFEVSTQRRRYRNKDNPAVALIRNVLLHRDENRGRAFQYFEYEKYVKSEYDLNNFTENWLDSRPMDGFEVLKDYVDTSDLNGKPYIPVMIQEKVSHIYERKYGKEKREIVIATTISGMRNSNISSGIDQFLSKIGGEVDIYESRILLFDKEFTSPISPIGPQVYRYYLTDSTKIEGKKYMKLSFVPRNRSLVGFKGFMWVGGEEMNYGVRSIELNIDKRANINYLDDMRIAQEFAYDSIIGWHLIKDRMIVDFQPQSKALGIYSTKTVSYRGFRVNQPQSDSIYSGINEVVYTQMQKDQRVEDWTKLRHDSLTEKEMRVYDLVDTLENIKQFKTINNIMYFLTTGFIPAGKIEVGPTGSFVSYNTVEGMRVRMGVRTSQKWSKKWRITAWAAYGFSDRRMKHGERIEHYIRKNPNRFFSLGYTDDLIQPGMITRGLGPDHFLYSFTRTLSINRFYERSVTMTYEHEWFPGLINILDFSGRQIEATRFNPFVHAVSDDVEGWINDNTISLTTRFSINEKYIQGVFRRISVKTTAPIFKIRYTVSNRAFGSTYNYHKLNLRVEKRFMEGLLGYTDITLEGDKIWGKVPYPLLIIHPGNETMVYNRDSYSLMNFMEFGSDMSVGLMAEHHFNGLLMGIIPGVNRLKMRVVLVGKVLYGQIRKENRDFNDPSFILPPDRLGSLQAKPYVEANLGVENIFSILRIDLVKRFTYLEADNIGSFFGVRGMAPRISFKFKF